VPGLAVQISESGKKTFYIIRKLNGRPKRFRIGGFGELSVEVARKRATSFNADISTGIDPTGERLAARNEMTIAVAFERYVDSLIKRGCRSMKERRRCFEKYCTSIHRQRLSEITSDCLESLHRRIGRDNGKTMANRVIQMVGAVFHFVSRKDPSAPNPAKAVDLFPERSRDRFLSGDEMRRFMLALEIESDLWKDYFLTLLLTGARRSNVERMAWCDLSIDRGLWRVPGEESKNNEPLIIILSAPVIRILQRRKNTTAGSEWVFPSPVDIAKPIQEPRRAWRRILKSAGIENLRIHDLRRSLGSWLASGGASLPMVGRILGHKTASATMVYARLDLDPVRAALESVTNSMLSLPEPGRQAVDP